jgi:hypothetical protein
MLRPATFLSLVLEKRPKFQKGKKRKTTQAAKHCLHQLRKRRHTGLKSRGSTNISFLSAMLSKDINHKICALPDRIGTFSTLQAMCSLCLLTTRLTPNGSLPCHAQLVAATNCGISSLN